jgi:hypothetical protein
MKLKSAKINFFVNRDFTEIEIFDSESSTQLCHIKLTPEQFSSALSRMGYTDCSVEVFENTFSKLNKKMENKRFSFEIPKMPGYMKETRDKELAALADAACPEGWESDNYFGSQESFFTKDGKNYASVIIRRWVDQEEKND